MPYQPNARKDFAPMTDTLMHTCSIGASLAIRFFEKPPFCPQKTQYRPFLGVKFSITFIISNSSRGPTPSDRNALDTCLQLGREQFGSSSQWAFSFFPDPCDSGLITRRLANSLRLFSQNRLQVAKVPFVSFLEQKAVFPCNVEIALK